MTARRADPPPGAGPRDRPDLYSEDRQNSLLGAVLQTPEAARKARQIVSPSDLYGDLQIRILAGCYEALDRFEQEGAPYDLVGIAEVLRRDDPQLQKVGGSERLARLVDFTPTTASVEYDARVVKKFALRRAYFAELKLALEEASRNGAELTGLIEAHRGRVSAIEEAVSTEPFLVLAGEVKVEAVEFVVDPILAAGMLGLLSGKDKRGKTNFAQVLAKAVLRGVPFLDRFPTAQGRVVGAFLDDPPSLTMQRIDTLGIREDPGLFLVHPDALGGDRSEFLARLEAESRRLMPRLIILDSLYQFMPSSKDAANDVSRMGPLMDRLNRMARETGAVLLVICHDNKGGTDVANSYVIRAAAKSILRLTLPRNVEEQQMDGPPTSPRRVLSIESKFGEAQAWGLEIKGPGVWRCYGSLEHIKASETSNAVSAFLQDGGTGTSGEIAKEIKKRDEDVVAALRALEATGEAVCSDVNTGKKGRPKRVWHFPSGDPEGNRIREEKSFGGDQEAQDFRSQEHLNSQAREEKSGQEDISFPVVTVDGDFPSGHSVTEEDFPSQGTNSDGEEVF